MACVLALALIAAPGSPRPARAAADLVAGEARIAADFTSRGFAYPPAAVTLVSLKDEGRIELWAARGAEWDFVRSYLVTSTSGRLGPKLRQGDHQVPEGLYRVSALNPRSRYHLSLRLDYPNLFDQARGAAEGRTLLGGDIMIHGDRVSDGCLPVGDRSIEELYALAERIGIENVAIVISPLDLRRIDAATALKRVRKPPRWLPSLYAQLEVALRAFPLPGPEPAPVVVPARLRVARPKCKPYDAADCERRCRAGDVASCARAGVLYGEGRGVPADRVKGRTLLGDACARGDAIGCGALGGLLLDDRGFGRDTSRAASLARAACKAGDGHGCARLARLCSDELFYAEAPGECSRRHVQQLRRDAVDALVSRESDEAILAVTSCRGWGAYDCATLGAVYADDGDADSALLFAGGSCAAGDPGGCDELGDVYRRLGDGRRAQALFTRACAAGFARSCARDGVTPVRASVPAPGRAG